MANPALVVFALLAVVGFFIVVGMFTGVLVRGSSSVVGTAGERHEFRLRE